MKQLGLFDNSRYSTDLINDDMNEDMFVRGVIVFAKNVDREILLNPGKKAIVKRNIYRSSGRVYFRNEEGIFVHRLNSPQKLMGKCFRDDYLRLEDEINKNFEAIGKYMEER